MEKKLDRECEKIVVKRKEGKKKNLDDGDDGDEVY